MLGQHFKKMGLTFPNIVELPLSGVYSLPVPTKD